MGFGHCSVFTATLLAFAGAVLAVLSATVGEDKLPWTVTTFYANDFSSSKLNWGLQKVESCTSVTLFGSTTTSCETGSYSSNSGSTISSDCNNAGQTAMSTMIVGGGLSLFGVLMVMLYFCDCCVKFRVTVIAWLLSIVLYVVAIAIWNNKCVSDISSDLYGSKANGNGMILALLALVVTIVALILQVVECFWFRITVVSEGLMRL